MKRTTIIAILLFSLMGCREHTSQPLSTDPYKRWHLYNLHDYTIDQMRGCFCPDGGETMRITVRSDTIALVTRLSNNTVLSSPSSGYYCTIDSLFGIIRYSKNDSLVITYDSLYGYPGKLDINPQLHPIDGGVLYITANLQIR